MKNAIKPITSEGWGIIGPYGNLWTDQYFRTRLAAQHAVKQAFPAGIPCIDDWRIVQVMQTLAVKEQVVQDIPQTLFSPEGGLS